MVDAKPDGGSGPPRGAKMPSTVAHLPRQVREELTRRLRRTGRAFREKDVQVVEAPLLKRAVGASALGNCMEWFDFGVYSYLAATLGKVFFPGASPAAQVISSFATFAAAFVVRPLGGLVFGPLGDRVGRQKVLATTMIMMALGTFSIGLIPSYATIGIAAPILLLLARMVQGFSTGGEYGGATTFVAEYSPDRRRGFLSSWLDFGTFVGYALGSALVTVLNLSLTDDQMLAWGWRLPFLIAGPLGVIGLYMRLKLEESPAFQQQLDEHEKGLAQESAGSEFKTIVREHWRPLLVCMGLVLLYNVTNYMVTGDLPMYQTETLDRSSGFSDVLVLIGMVWIVLLITFLGRLSDHVGRRPLYATGAAAMIVLAVPAFLLLKADGVWAPVAGVLLLSTLLACFAAPSAATLPALFPTAVRYAAMAIGFNFAVAAFGGTTPLVAEALVSISGDDLMPAYYLMVAGAIGLVTVRFLPESAHDEPVGGPVSAAVPRTGPAGARARSGRLDDGEVHEGVRVEPGSVPGVEPVGDDVLGLAGPHPAPHGRQGRRQGRPGGQERSRGRGLLPHGVQPYPHQYAVVVDRQRFPARERGAVQGESVPAAHERAASHGAVGQRGPEVGAGAGAAHQPPSRVPPDDGLDAGDGAGQRARGAHVRARAEDVPVARGAGQGAFEGARDDGGACLAPGRPLVPPGDRGAPQPQGEAAAARAGAGAHPGSFASRTPPQGTGADVGARRAPSRAFRTRTSPSAATAGAAPAGHHRAPVQHRVPALRDGVEDVPVEHERGTDAGPCDGVEHGEAGLGLAVDGPG
ncbi:Sialic acid transporter NanT [Streptomyces violaceorubidus]